MVKWENVKWEKCQMGIMSNGKNVKWEMSNGNVKWECQMGKMSNGKNVKWEKCQMGLSRQIPNPSFRPSLNSPMNLLPSE